MISDFVARTGLSIFAEVALVIFLAVFVGIALHLFTRKRGHYDAMARLPLHDDVER
jgi:cbb3-type cytochrome oxidase subunit 3